MSAISALAPAAVWQMFDLICSIPHPSGHEEALARRLREEALKRGLSAEIDAAGNLCIERPSAPGFEEVPPILMQGHIDMVPVAAEGKSFDFTREPVTPVIDGEWVRTDGTTLGADDGVGSAMALAALFDPEFRGAALRGIFTTDEEVGMTGANGVSAKWLQGKYLLNLDGEDDFCVGCAGGARQVFAIPVERESTPPGNGVLIRVRGMRGGHSGVEIQNRRGNALIYLVRLLDKLPVRVASLRGGRVENAISKEAEVHGTALLLLGELQRRSDAFARELAQEFDAPKAFGFDVIAAESLPETVWTMGCQNRILRALGTLPDGVLAWDAKWDMVRTSSNCAVARDEGTTLFITTSQRSTDDRAREQASRLIAAHFCSAGAAGEVKHPYPAWRPHEKSRLLDLALKLQTELSGSPWRSYVSQGGVEPAVFSKVNPELEILSFGPKQQDIHTPQERVEIASVSFAYRLLQRLLAALSRPA